MEEQSGYVRALFADGMLLTASDLNTLQAYYSEKHRLVQRAMLGYGVVCGLLVSREEHGLSVAPGLAVDGAGREIHIAHEYQVGFEEIFGLELSAPGIWYLCLEYQETICGESFMLPERPLESVVPNRALEGFRLLAKQRRTQEDICIAKADILYEDNKVVVKHVESPVDGFHFARHWESLIPKPPTPVRDIRATGLILFERNMCAGSRRALRSGEIRHGLGEGGGVEVTLFLESGTEQDETFSSGELSLFQIPVRMGVQVYPRRGTFAVAVRVRSPGWFPLRIRWTAVRRQAEQTQPTHVVEYFLPVKERPLPTEGDGFCIQPAAAALSVGQSIQFSLVSKEGNAVDGDFHVVEPNGGSVDKDGVYTSSVSTGLFHIEARPRGGSGFSASAYVFVTG